MSASSASPRPLPNQHVLLLGSGLCAPPFIHYIASHGYHLTVASRTLSKAKHIIDSLPSAAHKSRVRAIAYDVDQDTAELSKLNEIVKSLPELGVIVSLLPYIYHVAAARVSISHRVHFCTTSYVSPDMQSLHASAVDAGLLLLNECGVDPGLDHMSAQRFIDQIHASGGKIRGFESLCGGLPAPAANNNPLGYKLSWSPRGVLLASRNTAIYLDKDQVKTVVGAQLYEPEVGYKLQRVPSTLPPTQAGMAGTKELELEWYPNRDSTVYKEIYGIPEAQTIVRGTYRNKGWSQMMKYFSAFGLTSTDVDKSLPGTPLAKFTLETIQKAAAAASSTSSSSSSDVRSTIASLLSLPTTSDVLNRMEYLGLFRSDLTVSATGTTPLDVVCGLFEEKLQFAGREQDMIVMKHAFDIEFPSTTSAPSISSRRERWTSTLFDVGLQHIPGGHSSMSRTVSLPVAIAVRALLDGRLEGLTGIHRPIIPRLYNLILKEMEEFGVKFVERKENVQFWIRDEVKPGEERVILTPASAKELIQAGINIAIERSSTRCIRDEEYQAVGCELVPNGSWVTSAPLSSFVLGLKELPESNPSALFHRHIFFAHCYKNQAGWSSLLQRFHRGNGLLLDLEFLNDDNGRRVAAFGRAAGLVGAAVGVLQWAAKQRGSEIKQPLIPWKSIDSLLDECKQELSKVPADKGLPQVHVLGALGRCGSGALFVCEKLGLKSIKWDLEETKAGGPFPQLLDSHILVNCIYLSHPIPHFLTPDLLASSPSRRLSVLADVSCDTTNPHNPLPLYSSGTTLIHPIEKVKVKGSEHGLDVIAIDHLPSLIPLESSLDFSRDLTPHLLPLKGGDEWTSVWQRAVELYRKKLGEALAVGANGAK